jgi:glycosyltransferase involved in cell wall biosynthesis
MSRPVRLLYVINLTPYFNAHWLERVLAARAHGYEVHVAASAGLGEDVVRDAGLPFYPLGFTRGRSDLVTESGALLGTARLYEQLRPDLVHHITIKPIIYGGLAARWHRVPAVVNTVAGLGYVFSQHGARALLLQEMVKAAYRVALAHPNCKVVFENPDDRQDFLRWRLVTADKTLVIKGAGVDIVHFRPRVDQQGGAPTVVLASRLLWDKGVGVFVEAAAQVKRAHPDARLVIVGTRDAGSRDSIPELQLRDWAASGLVELWGHRADMPDVLAAATVVCLPSFYREGIPRVLIEAAACGRPIVTTDAPGCHEIVRHGENGLLVPVKDPKALAQAINELLADRERGERMGRAGRARVEAEFTTAGVVAQTLAVYADVTAASERRAGL